MKLDNTVKQKLDTKIRGFCLFCNPLAYEPNTYTVDDFGEMHTIPFPPSLLILDSEGFLYRYFLIHFDEKYRNINQSLAIIPKAYLKPSISNKTSNNGKIDNKYEETKRTDLIKTQNNENKDKMQIFFENASNKKIEEEEKKDNLKNQNLMTSNNFNKNVPFLGNPNNLNPTGFLNLDAPKPIFPQFQGNSLLNLPEQDIKAKKEELKPINIAFSNKNNNLNFGAMNFNTTNFSETGNELIQNPINTTFSQNKDSNISGGTFNLNNFSVLQPDNKPLSTPLNFNFSNPEKGLNLEGQKQTDLFTNLPGTKTITEKIPEKGLNLEGQKQPGFLTNFSGTNNNVTNPIMSQNFVFKPSSTNLLITEPKTNQEKS